MSDIKTQPDPGAIDGLPSGEIFAGYRDAELIEYRDPTLGEVGLPTKAFRVTDDMGPSYAIVEDPTFTFRSVAEGSGNEAETQDKVAASGNASLIEAALHEASTIQSFTEDPALGPLWRAFGFNYGEEQMSSQDGKARPRTILIPSSERVNVVLKNVFGRRPEDGFPVFKTFIREDGSSGWLGQDEFLRALEGGYYPSSDVKLHENVPRYFMGDALTHFSGYPFFTPELNHLIGKTAGNILACIENPADHDYISDDEVMTFNDEVDDLSLVLGQSIESGLKKSSPNAQGRYRAGDLFQHFTQGQDYRLPFRVSSLVRHAFSVSEKARTGSYRDSIGKDKKDQVGGALTGVILRRLAYNAVYMVNAAREHEAAKAAEAA